jgi:hypothetical protein
MNQVTSKSAQVIVNNIVKVLTIDGYDSFDTHYSLFMLTNLE